MRDKSGVYFDYNFVRNEPSEILSTASFFSFAVGIDSDEQNLEKTAKRLKGNFGYYTCEYNKDRKANLYQWDYPNMWLQCCILLLRVF